MYNMCKSVYPHYPHIIHRYVCSAGLIPTLNSVFDEFTLGHPSFASGFLFAFLRGQLYIEYPLLYMDYIWITIW